MSAENGQTSSFPVLPVRNMALLPHMATSLVVGRAPAVAAVEAALATEDKMLVIVAQKDSAVDAPGLDDLHSMGTLCTNTETGSYRGRTQSGGAGN